MEKQLCIAVSHLRQCIILLLCITLLTTSNLYASDSDTLKSLQSGKHFAIMRHAIAPGSGDPSYFDVKNCLSQRNLSQLGIEQSKAIGKRLRDSGITEAQVFTSQWCRCIDTATHLNLGIPTELPIINSFYKRYEREAEQTAALNTWLSTQDLSKPLILVTHQVNITALTGVYPASGEIIIMKREDNGTLSVSNRIETD